MLLSVALCQWTNANEDKAQARSVTFAAGPISLAAHKVRLEAVARRTKPGTFD